MGNPVYNLPSVWFRNCHQNKMYKVGGTEMLGGTKMKNYTKHARVAQLKAMHELMINANDEGIYMTWIYRMPDEPIEEDFEYIAESDEEYTACFDLFVKLIAKEGNRW